MPPRLLATATTLALGTIAAGRLSAQSATAAGDSLRPAWVFADHMVLQRDRPAPVFGSAKAGATVTVSFGGHTVRCTADQRGQWRVDLPAQAASATGRALTIASGGSEIEREDVLVGDVWLCAGQSNMDFPLERAQDGAAAAAGAGALTTLRLCNRTGVPSGGARRLTQEALSEIHPATYFHGSWQKASPAAAAPFSAVGFYFGRTLGQHLDVPVGLIDVSVGGSTTEGWVSRQRLSQERDLAPLLEDFLATDLSHPFIRERTSSQLGTWIDAGRPTPRPRHFFEPGFLFDSAIASLAPFALRGALWYQGESNAHRPDVADRLFRMMVAEWRTLWDQPRLPFLYVQLPGMGRPTWPEFRRVQAGWSDIPHTAMAISIDVGHPTDVHPVDKAPVGTRLARLALDRAYGRDIAADGPRPTAARKRTGVLEVAFQHAKGLAWAPDRSGTGFEVAGPSGPFHPATAEIRGSTVILSSPKVPAPIHARYAWAPFPKWSLINGAGLPAAPFDTRQLVPQKEAGTGK